VAAGNYNSGNVGLIFYMDIIGPLILIVLVVYTGLYKPTSQIPTDKTERPAEQASYLATEGE
jgi:hypothetical protein